jgi:hypothetical protein
MKMHASVPLFDSNVLKVVCISDTHNDDPRAHVPAGDILIHTGDMTESSTVQEFEAVLDWVGSLSHRVKVLVAGKVSQFSISHLTRSGNRDKTLDREGSRFSQEALDLLTSAKVKNSGIYYLDREILTVAYCAVGNSEPNPIKIYGNPLQPLFFGPIYPFGYKAHPDPASLAAWAGAPKVSDGVQIWAMHGPPRHRLDLTNVPGLTGCVAQAEKIAIAKPMLCVFGHFHYSWGVERVKWEGEDDEVAHVDLMTVSRERREEENRDGPETQSAFDFSGSGDYQKLVAGEETVFVNAAWTTMKKWQVEERNSPIVITLAF